MKYLSFVLFLSLFIFSCTEKNTPPSKDLTLIPRDKIIKRVHEGNFDYRNAVFKNQNGSTLSAADQKRLNDGALGKDYYQDASGVIKEIRVRPLELEDKFVEIQRRELAANPMQGIRLMEIDCDTVDAVYEEVARTNQEVRTNRGNVDNVDGQNLEMIVSAIEKCGWSDKHIKTTWMIFQNAPLGISAYYYPELKIYSDKGNLSKSSIAMLQDRLLMHHGYKQLYGTQIVGGELYKLEDPDNVNKRRTGLGMAPIEQYIGVWGLDFEQEKARMKQAEEG